MRIPSDFFLEYNLYDIIGTRTWEKQTIQMNILRLIRLTTYHLTLDNEMFADGTRALIPLYNIEIS